MSHGILETIWVELLTLNFLSEFFMSEEDYDDNYESFPFTGGYASQLQ